MKFETTTYIDAPSERVFEFINTPENDLGYISGLVEVDDIEELQNGGHRYDYVYKLAGIKLDGTVEITECEPNEHLVAEMSGPMRGTVTYAFSREEGGTQLTSTLDVDLSGTILDRVLEPVARTFLKRDHDSSLALLKTIIEAEVEAEAGAVVE